MKKLMGVLLMAGLFTAVIVVIMTRPALEVRGKSAAVQLSGQMTPEQQLAQDLALSDARVQAHTLGHRAEVFGVRTVTAGQYTAAASACATADCRQVEIYNWDEDVALTVLVNIDTREVLDVLRQPHMRPGINKRLHDLSMEIATNAPEVIAALGYKPSKDKVLAAVDASLLDTACGGQHLCVAPTFATDDGRILWAIVDLTAEELAGIDWTEAPPPGTFEPFIPTGCPAPGSVNRDGWTMDYATTGNDAMNVSNIAYNGVPVATSIKLVEWHADYGSSGYQDSTGCSSGGGGFTIYPYGETQVLDLLDGQNDVIGFEVVQDFRMGSWGSQCNYRYEQRIRFYNDGRFRPVSGAYGQGCGPTALYRPVVRINIAVNGDANDRFARWDGSDWQTMTTEDYLVPYVEAGHGPHHIDANGYSWLVEDTITGLGYYIVQDVGQYDGDRGRGDSPFLYPTLHHASEGDTDLYVFGSGCCHDDHQQGPHLYLNGESIADANIVLWYVPQADTDATGPDYYCWTVSGEPNPETYPCFMGPMFVPTGLPVPRFTYSEPVGVNQFVEFTNETASNSPTSYEWNFGDGSAVTTNITATHTFTQEGDYTVTLTTTNPTGSAVYTDTLAARIFAPTAAFTHSASTTVNQPVSFTNLTTGTPPMTYTWDFGDGSPLVIVANPTHTYTITGTFTITLTATNEFGSSTAVSTMDIMPLPALDYVNYFPFVIKEE